MNFLQLFPCSPFPHSSALSALSTCFSWEAPPLPSRHPVTPKGSKNRFHLSLLAAEFAFHFEIDSKFSIPGDCISPMRNTKTVYFCIGVSRAQGLGSYCSGNGKSMFLYCQLKITRRPAAPGCVYTFSSYRATYSTSTETKETILRRMCFLINTCVSSSRRKPTNKCMP